MRVQANGHEAQRLPTRRKTQEPAEPRTQRRTATFRNALTGADLRARLLLLPGKKLVAKHEAIWISKELAQVAQVAQILGGANTLGVCRN